MSEYTVRQLPGGYQVTALPGYQRVMLGQGPWLQLSGGDLPRPVWVAMSRHADGRFAVTGLLITDDEPREITSNTLRQIRLAAVVQALLADYDPDNPADWTEATSALLAADVNSKQGHAARGRSRGPDEDTLRDFARTYRIELARQPRRAMTAAAGAYKISRATAHRWAALCREHGYLAGD